MTSFAEFHRRSIEDRDAFWAEQAQLIYWRVPPQQICDYSNPPFARWFVGGQTNLCHNAIDRHVATRGNQAALIAVSTETNTERTYTYAELHQEVQRMAAALLTLGVKKGDLVTLAHAAKLFVHPWAYRNDLTLLASDFKGKVAAEYKLFYEVGVDGVFSDAPSDANKAR